MLKIIIDPIPEPLVFEASPGDNMQPGEIEEAVRRAGEVAQHYLSIATALDTIQYAPEERVSRILTQQFHAPGTLQISSEEGQTVYHIGSLTIIEKEKK